MSTTPLPLRATASSAPRAEMVVIEGVYAGPGVECPLFQITNGDLVTLSGKLPALERGATFKLTGRWARVSTCMQGQTFHVFDAEELKESK